MSALRSPIGKYQPPSSFDASLRRTLILQIEETPAHLRRAVEGLTVAQIDTPYREGGWTVRQVVHHLPDSHLNGYVRFKLALTVDNPKVKTYEEHLWAELKDTFETPIEVSLNLINSLHKRWVVLLKSLSDEQFERTFNHPEWGNRPLDKTLALYASHSIHHVAHITDLKKRMNW